MNTAQRYYNRNTAHDWPMNTPFDNCVLHQALVPAAAPTCDWYRVNDIFDAVAAIQSKQNAQVNKAINKAPTKSMTLFLRPDFERAYIYWDAEFWDGDQLVAEYRMPRQAGSTTYRYEPFAGLCCSDDMGAQWLLSNDKKKFRNIACERNNAFADFPLNNPQAVCGPRHVARLQKKKDEWTATCYTVDNIEIQAVCLCPAMGVLWLPPEIEDWPETTDRMFVLRRLVGKRGEGYPHRVHTTRKWDGWACHSHLITEALRPFTNSREHRRAFLTEDCINDLKHRELVRGYNWVDGDFRQVQNPRKFLEETKQTVAETIKQSVRRRVQRIAQKRGIKPKERLFFRMILGARELRNMVSMAAA